MAKAKQDLSDPTVQGPRVVDLRDGAVPQAAESEANVIDLRSQGSSSGLSDGSGLQEAAQRLVKQARASQGLSERISDPAVIGRIAALLQPIVDD
jgi:hypothetical protein